MYIPPRETITWCIYHLGVPQGVPLTHGCTTGCTSHTRVYTRRDTSHTCGCIPGGIPLIPGIYPQAYLSYPAYTHRCTSHAPLYPRVYLSCTVIPRVYLLPGCTSLFPFHCWAYSSLCRVSSLFPASSHTSGLFPFHCW